MALIKEEHEIRDEKEVIKKFSLNSLTLSFTDENEELETHFLVSFYNKSLNQVRFAIFMTIIIYSLFGIIDAALIPDFDNKFLILRYLLVIPMLLGILGLSFTKFYIRKIQFITSFAVISSGFGVITLIMLAPQNLANYYFLGLVLVLVMNYGFLKLRFVWSAIAGLAVTIPYIIGAFTFIHLPFLLGVVNSFFLIAINIVGFLVVRLLETYARKEYFTSQLLKIERMKLKTLNARLEAKIKDKAQQIGDLQKEILSDLEKEKKKQD